MISDEELNDRLNRYELKYSKLENMLKENEKIRKEFVDKFPINSLKTLTKEAYSIGEAYQDSFCYWLERKTEGLGSIRGATVNKFGLWYSTRDREYRTTEEFGNDPDSAIIIIRERLTLLTTNGIEHNIDEIAKIKLSPMVKGKILYLYFPEKYLNIFSENIVDYFLDVLGIDNERIGTVEKKRDALIHWKSENKTMKKAGADKWSNDVFTHFLYDQFKEAYAVIMKVSFNKKSGLTQEEYLDQLERGDWKESGWGTPRNYMKKLVEENKKGKLILFDRNIREITAEFEVDRVEKIPDDKDFPYRNYFDQTTFKRFKPQIDEDAILCVPGLESFNSNQSGFRILSKYQYLQLIEAGNDFEKNEDSEMKADYIFRHYEIADQELGRLGEEFVVEYEKEKLKHSHNPEIAKLANEVKRVGDIEHYDVKSFDNSGNKIMIEVKTTISSWDANFFITSNEIDHLKRHPKKYLLYRVYEFDKKSKKGKLMVYDSNFFDLSEYKPKLFTVTLMKKGTDFVK